jgi:hypothetical protein
VIVLEAVSTEALVAGAVLEATGVTPAAVTLTSVRNGRPLTF